MTRSTTARLSGAHRLALAVLALGGVYWLVRDQDRREAEGEAARIDAGGEVETPAWRPLGMGGADRHRGRPPAGE